MELPVIQSSKNRIIISAGKSKLIFDEVNNGENPFYHFAFNIPSNKFDEALQWMQNKVELLWLKDYKSYVADFVDWHAKSFYFKDPAGNILEMIARFDLNDTSETSFSSKHIRNISEIGIVFPLTNFDEHVNSVMKNFSINYFDKQPSLAHFRAVGNDEGLFVIVPDNRIWFATKNEMSEIFPMQIAFKENNKLHELKM